MVYINVFGTVIAHGVEISTSVQLKIKGQGQIYLNCFLQLVMQTLLSSVMEVIYNLYNDFLWCLEDKEYFYRQYDHGIKGQCLSY